MNVNFNLSFGAGYGPYGSWKKPGQTVHRTNRQEQPKIQGVSMVSKPLRNIDTIHSKNINELVLISKTPKELAENIKALNLTVSAYDAQHAGNSSTIEQAKETVQKITAKIDSKIDFKSLGVNPHSLTDEELIEYGAEFAFWTTSLDGKKRNGLERPFYVRSALEYIELIENEYPLFAAFEFKDIIARMPKSITEADKRQQEEYDLQYKKAYADYQRLPFTKKINTIEPRQKYSPIYGKLKILERAKATAHQDYVNKKTVSRQQAYDEWLQNTFDNSN